MAPNEQSTGRLGARLKAIWRSRSRSPTGTDQDRRPPPDRPAAPRQDQQTVAAAAAATGRRDLWQEAFGKLSESARSNIEKLAGGVVLSSQNLDGLIHMVEQKRDMCDRQTWKCKIGNWEIILRDYAVRLTRGLQLAGDVAVEFVPGPAKLVWPVIKGVMSATAANYAEQMGSVLMCSERIVRVVNLGGIYQQSYEGQAISDDAILLLQNELVRMYQAALEILANAANLFDKGTAGRTMNAILFPHQTPGLFSALADREADVDRVVQACGAAADARLLEMVRGPVARIDGGVGRLLEVVDQQTLANTLDWISKIDFISLHKAAKEGRVADTCQWLLEQGEFRTWKEVGASAILCLEGSPGTGKTVLTSKVVDYFDAGLEHSPHEALAFFYCRQTEAGRHDSLSVLRSYVRQLSYCATSQDQTSIRARLLPLYRSAQLSAKQSLDEDECKEQLLDSVNTYAATTIILDAFDECDKGSQENIIKVFRYLMAGSHRPLKVFVSSRPEEVQSLPWPRIRIRREHNGADIKKYVSTKIRDEFTPDLLKSMEDEISPSLLSRGGDMFEWVALQLRQLSKCKSREAILNRLKHLPDSLAETYRKIYKEIESLDKSDRKRADEAIMWVMCSRTPLGVGELLDAIRIDADNTGPPSSPVSRVDERTVLSLCNDLLVVDPVRQVWRFSHLSVLDYFQDQPTDSGLPNRRRAEEYIAKACLRFLIDIYSDGEGSKPAPLSANFNPGRELRDRISNDWFFHIRSQERGDDAPTSGPPTAPLLKTFLGAPGESSRHYRRWHQDMTSSWNGGGL